MAQRASASQLGRAKRLIAATRAFRAKVEKAQAPSFAADLGAYFTAQAGRLVLPAQESRKALPKKLDPLTLLDWTAEDATLLTIVESHFTDVAQLAIPFVGEQLGITVAFDLANPYIARVLDGVGVLVKGLNADSLKMLQGAIESGMAAGDGTDVIAGNLSDLVAGWSDARALTIARTETAHAYNWAATAGYRDSGIVPDCICLDSPDCGWDGHDDPELADGTVRSLDEAESFPTSHPNAIIAGTLVETLGEVQVGYRALWRGPLTTLQTASGVEMAIGPNHPVLTSRGWLAAKLIHPGDQVVRRTDGDLAVASFENDLEHAPARVEEIFEALWTTSRHARLIPAPDDFHGDGNFCQGKVDVVRADRPLPGEGHATLIEQLGQLVLMGARTQAEPLSRGGASFEPLDRIALAAAGGVRRLDVGRVVIPSAHQDPALTEPLPDDAVADADFLRELERRFACKVALDEVVEVGNHESYVGQAFDLQTQGRAYFGNSILLHNCVRAFAPNVDTGAGQLSDEEA